MKKIGIRVGKYRIISDKDITDLEDKLNQTEVLSEKQMVKINELHQTIETYKKLLDIEQQNTRMGYGK
jgi:hypothetical protein